MSTFWQDIGLKTKLFLQLALAIATIFFLFYLIPKVNSFKYSYENGKPWQFEDLYSPYDFSIAKQESVFFDEQEEIKKNHLKHYIKSNSRGESIKKFEKILYSRLSQIDSGNLMAKEEIFLLGKDVLENIYTKGLIGDDAPKEIILVENNLAKQKTTTSFFTPDQAKETISQDPNIIQNKLLFLIPLLKSSLLENIVFDDELNQTLLNNKLSGISSSSGLVKKGEKIIGKGEIININNFQKLSSFEKKYSEQILDKRQSNTIAFGYVLLIGVLISILVLYLFLYQKEIFFKFRKFSLIFLLINTALVLTLIFTRSGSLYVYILPFSIIPIVLRSFFKRETALYVHLTIILLAALFVPKAFPFIFMQVAAGITAIYGNKDVKYWSQFFKAIAFIFIAYFISYIGFSLIESGDISTIKWQIVGFLALNGFLSFLAYPLIVFFEKMFGLLSEITLVEFTDLNKPLLKRMSLESSGTFQHSLQVANLAEAAASEIGANSLLVKVGALYHDVGKMNQPIYFIENQFPDENPHSKLSFEESAKIIISHVTDGVILAQKNNIPTQIIEFIQTHHGTTRVEYFYRMHAKLNSDDKIDDKIFKYPGPAPFRKEHAILMMADSIEAASKSLKNPTNDSLNSLVDDIVSYQQNRGQFDSVPITLLEINRCKEVFKKMLASIYHIRIEYPTK